MQPARSKLGPSGIVECRQRQTRFFGPVSCAMSVPGVNYPDTRSFVRSRTVRPLLERKILRTDALVGKMLSFTPITAASFNKRFYRVHQVMPSRIASCQCKDLGRGMSVTLC